MEKYNRIITRHLTSAHEIETLKIKQNFRGFQKFKRRSKWFFERKYILLEGLKCLR